MAPDVRIAGVTAGYSTQPVLTRVSLEVAPGEFVGISGANGAGKTTLFRVILGFLKPVAGSVEVLGRRLDQSGAAHAVRSCIGYVPQQSSPGLLPMTVFDSVLSGRWGGAFAAWRRPTRQDRAKVDAILERVSLSAYRHLDLRELSGGLRQRVALARAIVREPRLVLMDEPTTFLDGESQSTFYSLTRALNREQGVTFLVISHDRELLTASCSRLFALEHGMLKEKM